MDLKSNLSIIAEGSRTFRHSLVLDYSVNVWFNVLHYALILTPILLIATRPGGMLLTINCCVKFIAFSLDSVEFSTFCRCGSTINKNT